MTFSRFLLAYTSALFSGDGVGEYLTVFQSAARFLIHVICSIMKQILILLILFVFGCSTRQESEKVNKIHSSKKEIEPDSIFQKECVFENLSKNFDIKIYFERHITKEVGDSSMIKIMITDKATRKRVDSMTIYSTYYFSNVFSDCLNTLSYSTNHNINKEIVDNDYGDIIVGDFNFDNKEDIATISNSGGNGGPSYNYYLQTIHKTFQLDPFLTDSMVYFPIKINPSNKTLVTYVHAGACCLGEDIYQLDPSTGKWTHTGHKILK